MSTPPQTPVKKPARDQFGRIKEKKTTPMTERQWVDYISERNVRAAKIATIRRRK